MALTKLPKSAFGTGSVDDTKIEDGTIQNVELSGSLANDRLINSTITINGTSTALGSSVSIMPFVEWQSVITGAGSSSTATAGEGYFIDTTSNTHTLNLPASATIGDTIAIKDYAGTFATNNLTIGRNGHNIQGTANDSLISTNRANLVLVYVDATKGWLYTDEHNVGDLQAATFITATGGTITTSGDYKIHTFTGDGCFVVSQIGNCAAPASQRDKVDYLVIAGGGSGGAADIAGGGGAGGFRLSNVTCMPGPQTSPLANPTGITITATTYPITVGGGGATPSTTANGDPGSIGNSGSNSVFSTITSAGGGGGGGNGLPIANGQPGGSGGGASYRCATGGSGNTPPTSPPQGNNGGNSSPNPGSPSWGQGGGGGAGAVGANGTGGPTGTGGNGGIGSYVVSSGFGGCNGTSGPVCGARYFAGGGGGAVEQSSGRPGGTGGAGGGGDGFTASPTNTNSTAGAANTGGGGGAGELGFNSPGAAGGKGIVIIRYKYQ